MTQIFEVMVFLTCAVLIVPLFKKWGLGTVIGYLVAGTIVGPFGLALITDVDQILHISELGVVLLLFLIGLELEPRKLWSMKVPVFGYGNAQLILTALLVFLLLAALNHFTQDSQSTLVSGVLGCALALSSTAFALQLLSEKNQLVTDHGQLAFSILLLQDLAIIPLLALLPLLSQAPPTSQTFSMFAVSPGWALVLVIMLIGLGHYLICPFFKFIAKTRNQEIFTAAALLIAIGTAVLMSLIGLSMSLGAFIAGVLLAESEYKHEVEANIQPFKGLLLGLFFIAVGMSLDWTMVQNQTGMVALCTAGLISIKFVVLLIIGKWAKLSMKSALYLAASLSQGGEFAFVLLTTAVSHQVVSPQISAFWAVVVTLSMMITPILLLFFEKIIFPRLVKEEQRPQYDAVTQPESPVIIAGFGRFGQIIARILHIKKIAFTALDSNFEQVDFVRQYGDKIYYGDATRLELLKSAKADQARVLLVAVDDIDTSVQIVALANKNFPHLKVYARARNRKHVHQLMQHKVEGFVRETFLSSVEMAKQLLQGLGMPFHEADTLTRTFREYDEQLLHNQYQYKDDLSKSIDVTKQAAKELETLFKIDDEKRSS